MHGKEMPCKPLAKPVTRLGLDKPVFPAVAADGPSVKVSGHIERPSRRQPYFNPQIRAKEGIIEQVCLDGHIL